MTDTPPLNVTQLNDRLAQVAAELAIPVARARLSSAPCSSRRCFPTRSRSRAAWASSSASANAGHARHPIWTSPPERAAKTSNDRSERDSRRDGAPCRRRKASKRAIRRPHPESRSPRRWARYAFTILVSRGPSTSCTRTGCRSRSSARRGERSTWRSPTRDRSERTRAEGDRRRTRAVR